MKKTLKLSYLLVLGTLLCSSQEMFASNYFTNATIGEESLKGIPISQVPTNKNIPVICTQIAKWIKANNMERELNITIPENYKIERTQCGTLLLNIEHLKSSTFKVGEGVINMLPEKQKNDLMTPPISNFSSSTSQSNEITNFQIEPNHNKIELFLEKIRHSLSTSSMNEEVEKLMLKNYKFPQISNTPLPLFSGKKEKGWGIWAKKEMSKRASEGDKIAELVLSTYGDSMDTSEDFADYAMRKYNEIYQQIKNNSNKGSSNLPSMLNLNISEPANDKEGQYVKIINDLKLEIEKLKFQLIQSGSKSGNLGSEVEKILADLKEYLKKETKIKYKKLDIMNDNEPYALRERLVDLLNETESTVAITSFLDHIKDSIVDNEFEKKNQRAEEITKAYFSLQEDPLLSSYNKNKIIEETNYNYKNLIMPLGIKVKDNMSKKPEKELFETRPVLMIYYLNPERKGQDVYWKNNLTTFTEMIKFSSKDDLALVCYYLKHYWQIPIVEKKNPAPLEHFITTIYNRFLQLTAQEKMGNEYKVDLIQMNKQMKNLPSFIDNTIKNDFKIDYIELENKYLEAYKKEYNIVLENIDVNNKPLLELLKWDREKFENRDFTRPNIEKMLIYVPKLTNDEIFALVYHLSDLHLGSSPIGETIFLFNSLKRMIEEQGFLMRKPAQIISGDSLQMSNLLEKDRESDLSLLDSKKQKTTDDEFSPPPPPPPPGFDFSPPPPPPGMENLNKANENK